MALKKIVFAITFCVLWNFIQNSARGDGDLRLAEKGKALAVIQTAEKNCPQITAFAAEELQTYLKKITGCDFSLVKGAGDVNPGLFRIVVGDCEEARKAGLEPDKLPPDSFYIWRQGNTLFICGNDDPAASLRDLLAFNLLKVKSWGTLLAVYYFLEEYCGVGWLFPGELGEYIPEKKELSVASSRACVKPGMEMRIGNRNISKYKDLIDIYGGERLKTEFNIFLLRLRFSSWRMAKSHYFAYEYSASRWIEKHPEYFALGPDGKRQTKITSGGWWMDISNPGLAHEVALDAIAYFKGEPASSRGLPQKQFDDFGFRHESFAINPADTPIGDYSPESKKWEGNMSGLAWKYYSQVAEEVGKECPGKMLSVWSYADYRSIPTSMEKAPENIRIYVVSQGPFDWMHNEKRISEEKRLRDWHAFSGHKLYVWVNGCLRGCRPHILEGVPSPIVSKIGPWMNFSAPYINGIYYTDYCTEYMFEASNIYMAYHLMWEPGAEAEKIISGFYGKSYGPAGETIRAMERKFEDIWKTSIVTPAFKEGALMMGDVRTIPTKMEVWENIYNEKVIAGFQEMMDEAVRLSRGSAFEKRVDLFRKYYWGKVLDTRNEYLKMMNDSDSMSITALKTSDTIKIDGIIDEEAWKKCRAATMNPLKDGEKAKVETEVRLLYDDEKLYVGIKCHEPFTKKLCTGWAKKHDDLNIWKDDEVEIFLDPSSSRKEYYQILANAAGQYADLKFTDRRNDISWNPGLESAVFIGDDFWSIETALRFKDMNAKAPVHGEKWKGNFCRARNLSDEHSGDKQLLSWSRFIKNSFNDPMGFAGILFADGEIPDGNILLDGDFETPELKKWNGQNFSSAVDFRWSGRRSMKLEKKEGGNLPCALLQRFPDKIKPETEYILSYYMKTENITPVPEKLSRFSGVGAELFLGGKSWHPCPDRFVTGTTDWRKYAVKFKTDGEINGVPSVRFILRDAAGTAWIDDVRIFPVEKQNVKQ